MPETVKELKALSQPLWQSFGGCGDFCATILGHNSKKIGGYCTIGYDRIYWDNGIQRNTMGYYGIQWGTMIQRFSLFWLLLL